jgi:hypothetical protein
MLQVHSLLLLGLPVALACDSLGVLPSATAPGIGGMYGKNADRDRHEAQPVAAVARATWPEGTTSHGPWSHPDGAQHILHGGSRMQYTKRRLNGSTARMALARRHDHARLRPGHPPGAAHLRPRRPAYRADNSRGPGGPRGPLRTPLRTRGTLSRPSISHCKPSWDPLILASGTFG